MDSNGSIVEDSIIKFAQNAKQRSVTIAPEKTKEILHYNVKNDHDININDGYDDEEEVMKEEEQDGGKGGEEEEERKNSGNNNSSNSNRWWRQYQ
jgi:hypothetical protein